MYYEKINEMLEKYTKYIQDRTDGYHELSKDELKQCVDMIVLMNKLLNAKELPK